MADDTKVVVDATTGDVVADVALTQEERSDRDARAIAAAQAAAAQEAAAAAWAADVALANDESKPLAERFPALMRVLNAAIGRAP